jgi:hypothetical protein
MSQMSTRLFGRRLILDCLNSIFVSLAHLRVQMDARAVPEEQKKISREHFRQVVGRAGKLADLAMLPGDHLSPRVFYDASALLGAVNRTRERLASEEASRKKG